MAKFCSVYSSSSGNCTYVGCSAGGILIDVGVSAKKIESALNGMGVDPSSIKGIFITHEHADHINGVRVFASRYNINVYATKGTLDGMYEYGVFQKPINAYIIPEKGVECAGMRVTPFSTPHDSYESCGYTVTTPDGKRIAVATDMGTITECVADAVTGCDLVLLESNHDVNMLRMGGYPYFLKERILSDRGHLSNELCADFARHLVKNGTSRLILGHLSKENNFPSLAYETTKAALTEGGFTEGRDYELTVAGDLNAPVSF